MNRIKWNDNWSFGLGELEKEPKKWEKIDLPHDWLIYDTRDLYKDSIGWYKKSFDYQEDGRKWIVRFGAVYMDSTIYVNGKEVGSWKYGYSTFEFDITGYLHEGSNEIKVRIVHMSPNSRWYSGAGIYRNVYLLRKPQSHLVSDGVYITPVRQGEAEPVCEPEKREKGISIRDHADWKVEIDTEVFLGDLSVQALEQVVYDTEQNQIALTKTELDFQSMKRNQVSVLHQEVRVSNPLLWDIGQGNLYRVVTNLYGADDTLLDCAEEKIGFRTIRMDANEGFFINGRHEKIKGACEHHGFGCLGAVSNKAVLKRKLQMLRSMGVNAIRTAHNMPSVEFMELADSMGFLVDSESFDMWGKGKTTYDYGRFFDEWATRDVASWIRRDRNHPSIIMWSVGNEIYDMHADEHGLEELKMLTAEVRKHDYKNHAKLTFASNYMKWDNTQKCGDFVDLVGYNYAEYLYEEHHKEHPDWVIYGSETASMLASRGVYHFPLNADILCEDNEQCSALGNCFAGWGAHDYLDNILADRDTKYSLGQFIWTGYDYFGEPTPYHTKNSYFGQIDTAGFPKDSYYIYKAEWTDYKEVPFVHVFPYWDFNEGETVDVCVCSNAPKVELFVNGKSLGSVCLDHVHGRELVPHWSVVYELGEICAVAYNESGQVIAKESRHSFGDAAQIRLQADKSLFNKDADDLIFVEVLAYDAEGYPVENANNRVHIEVSGAGRLVGIDNGDSTDFDQVKGKSKRLFQGKLLAVIAPKNGQEENAEIRVLVSSPGLPDTEIKLFANRNETSLNYGSQENVDQICVAQGTDFPVIAAGEKEIPIRKISLLCEKELLMTPENPCLFVKAKIEPENATYQDLSWKIVNDTGIEISIARIEEVSSNEIMVYACGDGEFRLRATAKNGGSVASVRSTLPVLIEGFGVSTMNPYERISTGLCKNRTDGLSEGVEHGVRFLGKRKTEILFDSFDFGTLGTQDITMELFKYMSEPIHFSMYSEDEKQFRTLLLEGTFQESASWLQFKKQTFHLKNKITGVHKIYFSSEDNFQFKSFAFELILRGLQKNYAADCDEIFGDSYQIVAGKIMENSLDAGEVCDEHQCIRNVEQIGNNVTLHFRNMDFGKNSVTKLILCGHSELAKNSIQLKIEKDGKSDTELLEFTKSDGYEIREYPIEPVCGKTEIRFVFLPGSQFDFSWFRFA